MSVARGRDAQRRLDAGDYELGAEDMLRQVADRGRQAREELIVGNAGLVVSIAQDFIRRGVPLIDLIQEGNLGLMRAIDKYDLGRSTRLSTYAIPWIKKKMCQAIDSKVRTIRLPAYTKRRVDRYLQTTSELRRRLERQPRLREVAQHLGWDMRRVRHIKAAARTTFSLDRRIKPDEDTEDGYFIEDARVAPPYKRLLQSEVLALMKRTIRNMPPREARTFMLYYGVIGRYNYLMEEAGSRVGITRERVRQLLLRALCRIRHPQGARKMRDFVRQDV